MEKRLHSDNAFVTLTYAPENVPEGDNLDPRDVQLFMKRLRKSWPKKLRFFAVGEYDDSGRPHYHLILFGYPACLYGMSRYTAQRRNCCAPCDAIRDVWGKGFTFVGSVEDRSVRYVCGYVVNKLKGLHESLYGDKYPEFARMSLRPGLGVGALAAVVEEWNRLDLERYEVDVPVSLRNAARRDPLGRYLVHKLRQMVGRDEKAPPEVLAAAEARLYDLRLASRADNENPSFKKKITEKFRGKADATEARYRNFGRRKKL